MRWEKPEVNNRLRGIPEGTKSPDRIGGSFGPGSRWGHSCNAIEGGKLLYVFGGYGKDNCQTNDVHVFDTVTQTWSMPTVTGIPPSPRDSHSCTTVGKRLFVYGGTDGKNPLKDLHILDTSSHSWRSPWLSGEGPEAREGHSATLIGKRLFIFGGCGKSWNSSDEVYYNDVYILDTETLVWERATTSGTPPSPRDSHTCSSWKNKLIVVGGEDASDNYLSDVHILDTDTLVWRVMSTSGQILPPRAGHSTVVLGKYLFIFGGFTEARKLYDDLHVLNVDTGFWNKVMTSGQGPSARFSVAGDCLDPQKGILVFIGGCNRCLEALDDMYYLYTGISTEIVQDEGRQEVSIRKELKKKCQEQYLPGSQTVNDKDVLKFGTMPELCQPESVSSYGPAGKQNLELHGTYPSKENAFEAKVTEVFHYGYTIETKIDGKTLRGILFSYKPSFSHAANDYLSRKRMAVDVDGNNMNAEPQLKAARPFEEETTFASNSNNSVLADSSETHTVTAISQASMAPFEESRFDKANDPPRSETEVPCIDSSITSNSMVTSPSIGDGRAPGTKEHDPLSNGHPPKSDLEQIVIASPL